VTRWTIRLALALYVVAITLWLARRPAAAGVWARRAWTVGLVFYLGHVAAAFHFFHQWSHQAAWEATARQTADLTGWHWGGGLWFNYAFTLVWLADCLWQWLGPASHRARPLWVTAIIQGFLGFMAFNATVIFETGPTRWIALVACCVFLAAWVVGRRPYRQVRFHP
jgi:hypothetical protein